jgi:hypothetical protein
VNNIKAHTYEEPDMIYVELDQEELTKAETCPKLLSKAKEPHVGFFCFSMLGSASRDRTYDQRVNSALLYR